MPAVRPTADFAHAALVLTTIESGRTFGHLYFEWHPDPLGYGKTPSRFSDPQRRKAANRFGVLYLGESLKVCFLEAILRDQRNGVVGNYPIEETELRIRLYAKIEIVEPLRVVELRGDGPIRMGVPSDVARSTRQALARAWSLAFHNHPQAPDGIIYASRLNEETNLAIYDRAIWKLRAKSVVQLIGAPGLAQVLEDLNVALA
jgi:hypothetical protein